MAFDILADENVDPKVVQDLENMGHSAEFVPEVSQLGSGTNDRPIAKYAVQNDRLILTTDRDFVSTISSTQHVGVLFIVDDNYSAFKVARIVDEISTHMGQSQVDVVHVSENWL